MLRKCLIVLMLWTWLAGLGLAASQNDQEKAIDARVVKRKGISIDEPKVYDDALLQQMLNAAQARLMSLQAIDQASITGKLGAVTGASLSYSSFGLNVQGGPTPSVLTTNKGATGSTLDLNKTTEAPTSNTSRTTDTVATTTEKSNQRTTGDPSRDVAVTAPSVTVPSSNAPAPSVALPSAFSVSASDILNEQMQLTYEIANLRLLLEGAQSDRMLKIDGNHSAVKPRLTIGFPITLEPDKRYKDAVAVVEVEVEVLKGHVLVPGALPSITALLPREKTYNVAAITERSTALGGGFATAVAGVSGSWIFGRKTYFIVKDQDTVALTFKPETAGRIGFQWQFRPVLGKSFVDGGLKQTFVQLAFPTEDFPEDIGQVRVRSYWRKYDSKKGLAKEVVGDSLREDHLAQGKAVGNIPMNLAPAFNPSMIEDLGNGQLLVTANDHFPGGTYVRLGSTLLQEGAGVTVRYNHLQFAAAASDLATKVLMIGSRDGTERELVVKAFEPGPIPWTPLSAPRSCMAKVVDESNSEVSLTFPGPIDKRHLRVDGNPAPPFFPLLLVIGGKAFGYSDAPVSVSADAKTLSLILPTAFLSANPDIVARPLFVERTYWNAARCSLRGFLNPASQSEKIAVMEQSKDYARYVLVGNGLSGATIDSPASVQFESPNLDDVRFFKLTADQAKANKIIAVKKAGASRPIFVALPAVEFKDAPKKDEPKAKERIVVGTDQVEIVGDSFKDFLRAFYDNIELPATKSGDAKTLTVRELRKHGVTAEPKTRDLLLLFKTGAVVVKVEVVNSRIETQQR